MATLTTNAVIAAHDRLTGPLNAMASRVAATQGRFAAMQQKVARGVSNAYAGMQRTTGVGMAGAAFGLYALTQNAMEFEKRMFGIGVATVPDAMEKGEDAIKSARAAIDDARLSAHKLSRAMGMSLDPLAEIMEAGQKGGIAKENAEGFTRTIAALRMTDPDAAVEGLAQFGVTLTKVYEADQKASGLSFGDYLRKQADAAAVAAAETQLSTGTVIEGLRQFQSVHAAMGVTHNQSTAMLASMAAKGQNAIESGQTLKSNALRVMVPTAPNIRAYDLAGLKRADYFGNIASLDAMKAATNLMQLSSGRISGKKKSAVQQAILKAQKDGTFTSDKFQQRMVNSIGKMLGMDMGIEANVDAVTEMWGNSVFSAGGKVNVEKLLRDVAALPEDKQRAFISQAFEGRRTNINTALIQSMQDGTYDKLLGKIGTSGGKFLDLTEQLFPETEFGKLLKMQASVDRMMKKLATSQGVMALVDSISSLAGAIDQVNPSVVQMGSWALIFGLLGGPAIAAARGIGMIAASAIGLGTAAKLAAGSRGVAALNAAAAASPFFSLAAQRKLGAKQAAAVSAQMLAGMGLKAQQSQRLLMGMSAAGMAASATQAGWLARLTGAMPMLGKIARVGMTLGKFTIGGAIVGGAAMLAANFDKVGATLDRLGQTEAGKRLSAEWDKLGGLFTTIGDKIGNGMDRAARAVLGFFNVEVRTDGVLFTIFERLTRFLANVVEKANAAGQAISAMLSGRLPSWFGGGAPAGPPPAAGAPALGGIETGMPGTIDLNANGPVSVQQQGTTTTEVLNFPPPPVFPTAGEIGAAVAAAMQSAPLNVNVSGGGGGGGGGGSAKAPPVTTSNGAGYGGK